MELLDMVRRYQELLETKEQLAQATKDNNAAIEAAKERIAQQMVDDDCPRISTGGYSFSLANKTIYSKRSDAELAENGVVYFDVLREEGLGDIIVETVNARTLQAAVKAYVEENGELSEELDSIIKSYETYDITRRRESAKAGGKK
jgi:GTP cyclohydrolase II